MSTTIPHLSKDGWMRNPATVVNKLFEYFIIADYSQSNTFRGEIASIRYILEKYTQPDEIKSEINKALYKMYERYFKDVLINTAVTPTDTSLVVTINIDVTAGDGMRYRLDQNIHTSGGTISNMNTLIAKLHEF